MAELSITIDASEFIKAFNMGVEVGFMIANETPELETELNINNIDLPNGD